MENWCYNCFGTHSNCLRDYFHWSGNILRALAWKMAKKTNAQKNKLNQKSIISLIIPLWFTEIPFVILLEIQSRLAMGWNSNTSGSSLKTAIRVRLIPHLGSVGEGFEPWVFRRNTFNSSWNVLPPIPAQAGIHLSLKIGAKIPPVSSFSLDGRRPGWGYTTK